MIKVIAEIGSNFQPGNLQSAFDMIRIAAECGADVVKFQILDVDDINRPQEWKDRCRPWDTPDSWRGKLANEARRLNVDFLFSIFTASKVMLYSLTGVLKVASSEMGNQKLLHAMNNVLISDTMLNVYMSVPPDKHPALIPALTWLNNCRVTLLHCVPEYPAKDPLLDNITELAKLGLPIGWSSHVAYPDAVECARRAVDLGAVVVEAHLRDFSTPKEAPDNGPWSLYPGEFAELVRGVKG